MTSIEFKEKFPQSAFTLDSFLLLIKNSLGILSTYQCTKDAISLNKICCVNKISGASPILTNQVALILNGTTGQSLGVSSTITYFDVNSNAVTLQTNAELKDLVYSRTMTTTDGTMNVAIFDLF